MRRVDSKNVGEFLTRYVHLPGSILPRPPPPHLPHFSPSFSSSQSSFPVSPPPPSSYSLSFFSKSSLFLIFLLFFLLPVTFLLTIILPVFVFFCSYSPSSFLSVFLPTSFSSHSSSHPFPYRPSHFPLYTFSSF